MTVAVRVGHIERRTAVVGGGRLYWRLRGSGSRDGWRRRTFNNGRASLSLLPFTLPSCFTDAASRTVVKHPRLLIASISRPDAKNLSKRQKLHARFLAWCSQSPLELAPSEDAEVSCFSFLFACGSLLFSSVLS